MLAPQFTLKRLLAGVTLSALACLVIAAAVRGQLWAGAALIALLGAFVLLVVHALFFVLIQSLASAFRRHRAPTVPNERIPTT